MKVCFAVCLALVVQAFSDANSAPHLLSLEFSQAHNIDSVCIEALSVTLNDRGLEQATRSLGRLSSEVARIKSTDSQRLQQEYQNLVNGLIDQGLLDAPANEAGLASVSVVGLT